MKTMISFIHKIKMLTIISSLLFVLQGCSSGSGLKSAYNIAQCEYKFSSVSDVTLSGINFSNGVNPFQLTKVLSLLSEPQTSLPLDFVLNLQINNPNSSVAALDGLNYILSVDDVELTAGKIDQRLSIEPKETKIFPMRVNLDLAELMTGQSKVVVENIIKNLLGFESGESVVQLRLKPTVNVGSIPVTSPVYIPVSFSLSDRQ